MEIIYLSINNQTNVENGKAVYETSLLIETAGVSAPIMLEDEEGKADFWSAAVHPGEGGGSGYVQSTVSPREDVKNGLAKWLTWDNGTVSAAAVTTFYPVSAVRFINVSGTITGEVLVS